MTVTDAASTSRFGVGDTVICNGVTHVEVLGLSALWPLESARRRCRRDRRAGFALMLLRYDSVTGEADIPPAIG